MSSRLRAAFESARAEDRAALVAFLCAGDPDLDTTVELLVAVARAGADVVELGVPFSDPTADGPVIQRASQRSLQGGTTPAAVLGALRRARERTDVPVVVFGYYNPILRAGEEAFASAAAAAGADGLLVVDLPPEEAGALADACDACALDLVPLLAPTSSDARVALAGRRARGFVYYVSTAGVTGAASVDLGAAAARARAIGERLALPVAVGFGVATPDDARRVAAQADGVVVGSAIVRLVESAPTSAAAVEAVGAFVTELRAACRRR